ncbi:MAG: hypothetical protein LDL55_04690 [Armatimonadetes bacterium]|nr:hypothetical protein [Armatimonadota bacterium]
MWRRLAVLDRVPRQTIYLLMFLACGLPFFFDVRLPLYVWPETRAVFEVTDSTPPNKVVLICSNWVQGSQGENWPQYEALVSHLMMRGIKFVVVAVDSDPLAPQFSERVNERQAAKYGRKYGVDWVNLGMVRGAPLIMASIGRNIKSVFPRDYRGYSTNDAEKLPILRNVTGAADFQILWAIEYQPSLDWMVWLDPAGRVPVAFGSAGIVTTSWYPYISSGQMKGMMAGIRGAAEYETLVRNKYGKRYDEEGLRGGRLLVPLAFGHLVIISFILLGNLGMIAKRRAAKEAGR